MKKKKSTNKKKPSVLAAPKPDGVNRPEADQLGAYPALSDGIKHSIIMAAHLGALGERRRTDEESAALRRCQSEIVANAEEIVKTVCAREISEIVMELEHYDRWEGNGVVLHLLALDKVLAACTVPLLEDGFANVENINRVLTEMYERFSTVNDRLEEIRPVVFRWQKYERRMEDVIKGLVDLDHEWKARALVTTFMPAGMYDKIRMLESYVERFSIRKDALSQAYEIVSRMMTLHLGAPAGEFSRSMAAVDSAAAEDVRGVHRKDRRRQGPASLYRDAGREPSFGKKAKK